MGRKSARDGKGGNIITEGQQVEAMAQHVAQSMVLPYTVTGRTITAVNNYVANGVYTGLDLVLDNGAVLVIEGTFQVTARENALDPSGSRRPIIELSGDDVIEGEGVELD